VGSLGEILHQLKNRGAHNDREHHIAKGFFTDARQDEFAQPSAEQADADEEGNKHQMLSEEIAIEQIDHCPARVHAQIDDGRCGDENVIGQAKCRQSEPANGTARAHQSCQNPDTEPPKNKLRWLRAMVLFELRMR